MKAKSSRLQKALTAVVLAVALSGCSAVIDNTPSSLGGLPEGTPARPAKQAPFPKVHVMPPARTDAAMSEAEAKRLRDELKLTRSKIAPPPEAATGSVPKP